MKYYHNILSANSLNKMKSAVYLLLFVCVSQISTFCVAQKQANIWHFGEGRSLDFSSGAPVSLTGSQMVTFEGCASYCDKYGNFLFYTNGGGREPAASGGQDGGHIWNRNHAVMYDMQGTEGGGSSSVQSAVIFEAPEQDSVYYVFTMEEIEWNIGASPAVIAAQPLGRGLSYFMVDMRLNGGLGSVVTANQLVYKPSYEGLCAIKHANKRDYWIIINQDSVGLGVYSVTPTGVNFAGTYTGLGGSYGLIKASPNGNYVMATLGNSSPTSYLLQFDDNNGQFSNPTALGTQSLGWEFSPNSRFLYKVENNSGSNQDEIIRYDLQAANVSSSATVIGIVGNSTTYNLQLGPDGKIYCIDSNYGTGSVYIHSINCPNTFNATLNLNVFNYYFGPNGPFSALPNFSAWLFENDDSTYVSLGLDTLNLCKVGGSYTLNALNPGASFLWSNGATTQSITVNTHGTYSVTVTGTCGIGTDEVVVIDGLPEYPTVTTVNGNILSTPPQNATTYQWVKCPNYTPIIGEVSNTYTAALSGEFAVIVTNSCGADTSDCVQVNIISIDESAQIDYNIYPNPTNGDIIIKTDLSLMDKSYHIYNQMGQIVATGKLTAQNTAISLSNFSTGMYMMVIEGSKRQSFKIIKL